MLLGTLRFVAIVSIAIAMAGGLAHAFEFSAKMNLSKADYLVVQQIYRGWFLLGIPILIGLLCSLAIAYLVRSHRLCLALTLTAAIALGAQLASFFAFTQPVNRETANWTELPEHWESLRTQWELSHLASATLFVIAFVTMVLSVLAAPFERERHGVYTDRVYRSMFG
jgi:hypothetical protein